jgi:3-isopropylmalate/(R)-2-methylmalate dehydratase small subunit
MRQPVSVIKGRAVPLNRENVDTDQIMPARHLRRIERTGFGRYLFELWREDPAFVLNDSRYSGAPILLAGRNFGCGSSREHAPWALEDYGFRVIIAPSFADIFRGNAGNIGLATAVMPQDVCEALIARSIADPSSELAVDFGRQVVEYDGRSAPFEIDAFARRCIMEGLDLIDVTLKSIPQIEAFERKRPAWMPSTKA